jgi:O-antigen ligase
MISNFPRTQVLGVYPNSTGLLFILLYVIVVTLSFYEYSFKRKILITTLLVIVCFLTGSRTYWLLSIFFFVILFIRNKSILSLISLVTPFLIIAGLVIVEYLLTLRTGSNDARAVIYENSFKLMWETNPLLGIGIKPKMPELIHGPYPVGSHSTIWGYVIKCGLVGALFMFVLIAIPVYKFMEMMVLQLFYRTPFNRQTFFILSSTIIIIIALAMEDLDTFEILPLYFGIFLWIYDNRNNLRKHEL